MKIVYNLTYCNLNKKVKGGVVLETAVYNLTYCNLKWDYRVG